MHVRGHVTHMYNMCMYPFSSSLGVTVGGAAEEGGGGGGREEIEGGAGERETETTTAGRYGCRHAHTHAHMIGVASFPGPRA